jgi:hypothetical protein
MYCPCSDAKPKQRGLLVMRWLEAVTAFSGVAIPLFC